MDIKAVIAVGIPLTIGLISFFFYRRSVIRDKKSLAADIKREFEIIGKVAAVKIMPYIPGGFFSDSRPPQTLIVFEDDSEVTIDGLHLRIKEGQTWRIKFLGTDKWFPVRQLIEKELIIKRT